MARTTCPIREPLSWKAMADHHAVILPRKIMMIHKSLNIVNSVNGNFPVSGVASLGREGYVQQVRLDRHPATARKNKIKTKVSTWNVRTMLQNGKLENIKQEMTRMRIDILGLSEVRWLGAGSTLCDGHRIIYSGGDKRERGVAVFLSPEMTRCFKGYWAVSDRVIVVKIRGTPFDLGIIQVYAPTSTHSDEEVEKFYEDIDKALKCLDSNTIPVVIGDFNAKVGEGREENVVGPYGLGIRNDRGDRLIEWCMEHKFIISNTWFQNHKRRRWTWMSPGDRTRNQIDFILIPERFRNAVLCAKSMPGADCFSDHIPVVCILKIKLRKLKRPKKCTVYDHNSLHKEHIQQQFQIATQNKFEALDSLTTAEEKWCQFKEAIQEASEETLPKKPKKEHKKWMNEEILDMMETRRKLKKDEQRYKEMHKLVKKKCNKAKEEWLDQQCQDIELSQWINCPKTMHENIKMISGKKQSPPNGGGIKDKDGNIIMDKEEILNRWSGYIEELFADERGAKPEIFRPLDGPPIMKEEVAAALTKMKNGKATGPDQISSEMLKALGEWGIVQLTDILNAIYDSGEIPAELMKSTFITIPKKPGANECSMHRTISLMNHVTKILLTIILNRARNKITPEISDTQFGFVPNKGTRNAIFTLKTMIERSIEMQRDLYLCFIDYAKAFDRVKHEDLFKMLLDIGLDGKDLRIIRNIYWDQSAAIRIDGELSSFTAIKRGVRQGCVLSPDLFNLYSEVILRNIKDCEGLKIGGENFNNLRYADDTVLIATCEEDLQKALDKVANASKEKGLDLNVSKTECMVTTKKKIMPNCLISREGQQIAQKESFKYLGYTITSSCKDIQEIKRRIAIAKDAFNKMKTVFKNKNISSKTKLKILETYIWSILLYGCECWTLNKEYERRIEATEIWFYRRILGISWKDKVKNKTVLLKAGKTNPCLLPIIRKRQLQFLGHAIRKDEIEKRVIMGKIAGRRDRGRQRQTYMSSLNELCTHGQTPILELIRKADNREEWKCMIVNVCSSGRNSGGFPQTGT